jgi:hypothetical protein
MPLSPPLHILFSLISRVETHLFYEALGEAEGEGGVISPVTRL